MNSSLRYGMKLTRAILHYLHHWLLFWFSIFRKKKWVHYIFLFFYRNSLYAYIYSLLSTVFLIIFLPVMALDDFYGTVTVIIVHYYCCCLVGRLLSGNSCFYFLLFLYFKIRMNECWKFWNEEQQNLKWITFVGRSIYKYFSLEIPFY